MASSYPFGALISGENGIGKSSGGLHKTPAEGNNKEHGKAP